MNYKVHKNQNLLSPKEVAELYGIDRRTIYRLIRDGELKVIRIGSRWKIPYEVASEFLRSLEVHCQDETLRMMLEVERREAERIRMMVGADSAQSEPSDSKGDQP